MHPLRISSANDRVCYYFLYMKRELQEGVAHAFAYNLILHNCLEIMFSQMAT